jgi:hypothetical protein
MLERRIRARLVMTGLAALSSLACRMHFAGLSLSNWSLFVEKRRVVGVVVLRQLD